MKLSPWTKGGAAVASAALFALACLFSARGAETTQTPVRIGLVKTLFRNVPEFLIPIGLRPMKELMENQTGVPGDLLPAGDAEHLAQRIKDDDMQFGVFHGLEFSWVQKDYPNLKPLVIAVNQKPILHALLVVREDGNIAAPGNLQGKAVAMPRMSREHCRVFFERRCCPPGQEPQKFFGEVCSPFDVEDALDSVVDKDCQAAVVDDVDFSAYQKNKPGRAAQLKVLQESEAFPCAVFAYDPDHVSQKVVTLFHDGLIGAKDNPKAQSLLKANRITGFDEVPEDYKQELDDINKAYPPPDAK